ncbi:hypothetical protein V498_06810 [Pseudogymnoascus sp. VKM F-4517 (FW-2822)]|nr:hypothetical protein V498_06810 [Pseudogymnoascus sp. VKM F-4517 (FW-2822)]
MMDAKDATEEILTTIANPYEEKSQEMTVASTALPTGQVESHDRSKTRITVIMAALCLSAFLTVLDFMIMTTAIPTISEHFNSSAGYTWVGSAYLLANAASTPTWGKLSDIWGRKSIILVATAVFFIGSLICGISTSILMLVSGRAVQGAGGGGLIILVNICISDLFSVRNRAAYFGLIAIVWAVAGAIGPLLGGLFTQLLSWRWCFYINLPCSALSFFVILFSLDLKVPETPLVAGLKAIDWLGGITITGATLMLLLSLEFGGVIFPWTSPKVICVITFGLVTGALFFLNEAKLARYPIMPLRLFKHRSNIAALLTYISGSYYLPLYFQAVHGASPVRSGIYLLPYAVVLSLTSACTGIFIRKTGRYLEPIWFGTILMTLGFGLFIDLDVNTTWVKIVLFQIVAGLGVGPNFQAPLIALQTLVSAKDNASGTSAFIFTRNLASSISVVLGGVVFQNCMELRSAQLSKELGPGIAAQLSGRHAASNAMVVQSLELAQRDVARTAFSESLGMLWVLYASVAVVGMVASGFISRQTLCKEHEEPVTGLEYEEAKREGFAE